MAEWIIEADIYRYRKKLAGLDQGPKRLRLLERLRAAEAMLTRYKVDGPVLVNSNA